MPQTVEQFLLEQLEKVAPGKYTLASVLQRFKSKLRFPCSHLKGGRANGQIAFGVPPAKDYNIMVFTFATGVTEIRCLYNCGFKIRSDEQDATTLNEAYDLRTSNSPASSQTFFEVKNGKRLPIDPGPVPTYTDEQRRRIRESGEIFMEQLPKMLEEGRVKAGDPILGGVFPHPDPVEAPDSIVECGITREFHKVKGKQSAFKATVVCQDNSVPALEPVKTNTKIRKSRKASKTQSRKRG
jgi:hypothetical protein